MKTLILYKFSTIVVMKLVKLYLTVFLDFLTLCIVWHFQQTEKIMIDEEIHVEQPINHPLMQHDVNQTVENREQPCLGPQSLQLRV